MADAADEAMITTPLPLRIAACALLLFIGQHVMCSSDGATSLTVARARAIAVAYVCDLYATDNGVYPNSIADLRFPLDYVAGFERDYGLSFDELTADPPGTPGPAKLFFKPVVKEWPTEGAPSWTWHGQTGFAVISCAGRGAELYFANVLHELSLKGETDFTDASAPIWCLRIGAGRIFGFDAEEDFDIREILAQAEIRWNEAGPDTAGAASPEAQADDE